MTSGRSDWIEVNIPYGSYSRDGEKEDSLCSRGLAIPGVLIRVKGRKGVFLIGDINELRGVCDDCTEFRQEDIVEAYKVVWERERCWNVRNPDQQ